MGKSQTRYNDLSQKYIHAKSLVVTYLTHIFAEKAQPVCQEKFTEGELGTLWATKGGPSVPFLIYLGICGIKWAIQYANQPIKLTFDYSPFITFAYQLILGVFLALRPRHVSDKTLDLNQERWTVMLPIILSSLRVVDLK